MRLDRARLRHARRDEVVDARVGDVREVRAPGVHRAVVDEAQPAVAVLIEQRVRLERVDLATEEVRDLAAAVPRVVVFQASGVAIEQQGRRAGGADLLEDRARLPGLQVAREPLLLAVEDEAGADLEDVRALAEQPGRDRDGLLGPARHEEDLTTGAQAVSLRRLDKRTTHAPLRTPASIARAPSSVAFPSPSCSS